MSAAAPGAPTPEEAYIEFYKDCELNNVSALQGLLAEDFELTHMGHQQNKSDFLLNVSSGALNVYKRGHGPNKITVAPDNLSLKGMTMVTAGVWGGPWDKPTILNMTMYLTCADGRYRIRRIQTSAW